MNQGKNQGISLKHLLVIIMISLIEIRSLLRRSKDLLKILVRAVGSRILIKAMACYKVPV